MHAISEAEDELALLCDAAIEGRLTPEQLERLEALVRDDPAARRTYAEYLHQHGTLHWSAADPAQLPTPRALRPRSRWLGLQVGIAISLLLTALSVWLAVFDTRGSTGPIATLTTLKACKWDGGSLPTEAGARLAPGRLRLSEGLAEIAFDGGATVKLEGPADLELVDKNRCALHAGRLTATVPPPAIGFTVVTPMAVLHDQGTEFGVNVHDGRTSDVQVFQGQVDVKHRVSGVVSAVRTGENVRAAADGVTPFDPARETPPRGPEAGGVIQLTTATGRGSDAYVQPVVTKVHQSDILLLVKNSTAERSDYFRKAYMAFDLAPLAGQKVADAGLTLALAPTGMGFAAEVPDATFVLYGLTDEALDGWDGATMRWADAPANRDGGDALDASKVVELGRFVVEQGVASGSRTVAGPALAAFLNRDANGRATLILVRETKGSGRNDLVHGFANRRHPTLPPPTLKVTVEPRP